MEGPRAVKSIGTHRSTGVGAVDNRRRLVRKAPTGRSGEPATSLVERPEPPMARLLKTAGQAVGKPTRGRGLSCHSPPEGNREPGRLVDGRFSDRDARRSWPSLRSFPFHFQIRGAKWGILRFSGTLHGTSRTAREPRKTLGENVVAPTGFEPVFEQGHVSASSHEILQIVTLRKMWRDSNTDLLRHHSRPRRFSNPCVALKQLPTGATRRAHP